jgi:outer membrane protein TolC
LFAIETGGAIIDGYLAEATGLEKVALAGLRMLTGVAEGDELQLADKRLEAWPLPEQDLNTLMAQALKDRPEMSQVSAGLAARHALVEANKAEAYPNLYYGVGGIVSYSPLRENTEELSVYDSFNTYGATPVIGLKWDWYSGRQRGKVAQAQAEYDTVLETKAFAQQGIPFQVAELYHQVHLNHEKVDRLYKGARSGRRWLIATFADFEAGIEQSDKLTAAFQGYLLVYSDYVQSVNNYNVNLAKLRVAIGEVK